jgi:hypothetical protein
MTAKTDLLLGLILVLGGCTFDGNTNVDVSTGGQNDGETTGIFSATGEDTKKGGLVEGTYLDSNFADGVSQVILAETNRDSERLKHTWELGPMPAGSYELTIVAHASTPASVDEFFLEYETDLGGGNTHLLYLGASNAVESYSSLVTLSAESSLLLSVELDDKLATTDGSDNPIPLRQISVDYIALSRVD